MVLCHRNRVRSLRRNSSCCLAKQLRATRCIINNCPHVFAKTSCFPLRSEQNPVNHRCVCASQRQCRDGGRRPGHARRKHHQTYGQENPPAVQRQNSRWIRRVHSGRFFALRPF